MKRLFATIVALMLLVNLAACGGKEASVDDGADGNSFSKTETSVSEEMEEMDEVEEQDIQEIAEVANIPKDISEVNPDDYWQGDDYFDLERFLTDCGFSNFNWDNGKDYSYLYCYNKNFVLEISTMGSYDPPQTGIKLINLSTKDYYTPTLPANTEADKTLLDIMQVGSSAEYFMTKKGFYAIVPKIPFTNFDSQNDPWETFTVDYITYMASGEIIYHQDPIKPQ